MAMNLTEALLKYFPVKNKTEVMEAVVKGLVEFLENFPLVNSAEILKSLEEIQNQDKLGFKGYLKFRNQVYNFSSSYLKNFIREKSLANKLRDEEIYFKPLREAVTDFLKKKHPGFDFKLELVHGKGGIKSFKGNVYYKREVELDRYLEQRLTQNSNPTLRYIFKDK